MTREVASMAAPPSPSRSPTVDRGNKRPAQDDEANDRASASPKRQRVTSPDVSKPSESHETATSPKRTRPSLDERKRNKRLFGNLLSTLSQKPATSTTQRRREEIDSRKRDELAARTAELEARSEERAARTLALRKRCQRKVEERALKVRHEGMRAMAGCLRTEAEPRLYWRPWEWRPEEEGKVLRQKEDVEVEIQREEEEFEERMRRKILESADGQEDGADAVMTEPAEKAPSGNEHEDHGRKGEEVIAMTKVDGENEGQVPRQSEVPNEVPHQQAQPEEAQRRSSMDEAGDAMVDAGEDTLMY